MMHTVTGMMSIPGFGPDRFVFNFEDEVESLYLSDALPQQDDPLPQQQQQQGACDDIQAPPPLVSIFDRQDSFDLVTVKPEDITGQSLAFKMEEDKREVLQHLETKTFPAAAEEMKKNDSAEFSDDLIREMEDFLAQYEVGSEGDLSKDLLSFEQQRVLENTDAPCPAESDMLTEEDTRVAEEMLDALLEQVDDDQSEESWLHSQAASDLLHLGLESESSEGGFTEEVRKDSITVSNLSQHPAVDVIFVITPSYDDDAASRFSAVASSPSQCGGDDEDSDWVPETKTRKSEPRTPLSLGGGGRVRKDSVKVMDRKQRKKLQNMEAARRYRDKKKQEHSKVQTEEAALADKNAALKIQLKDMENEMKTMKKLMNELGILRVISR